MSGDAMALGDHSPPVPESAEVVVIGGGPAGLAAALELAWRGIGVVVIEPRDEVSADRPRAKTTSVRTMEHLRRWGLAERVRQKAPLPVAWSQDAAFVSALLGEEITRITGCFGMSPDRQDVAAESGQQIAQPLLESILREAVTGHATATLATGWFMTGLRESSGHVLVSVRHAGGRSRQIRAQYVLGCDGSRSATREAIGARYEGSADTRTNFNVVFRAPGLLARIRLAPAIHYWVIDAETPGLVGPMDLNDTWWAMAMGVDADAGNADPGRLLRALIGPGASDVDIEVVATDPWSARMLIADSYGRGRVYLVGDAAHLNPPWGGHGFNTAVGDAVNIGWKLAAILRGWAGPALLRSYEAERRPVAAQTIDVATKNMRTLSAELAGQSAADHIQATKDGEFHSLGLVLGYRYDESPVVAADQAPAPALDPGHYIPSTRPGSRLPHVWLRDGRSVFDLLGKAMTVLVLDPAADATPFLTAADRLGVPVEIVDVSAAGLPDAAGYGMLLVRPDQHIAWRGTNPGIDSHEAGRCIRRSLGL